MSEIREADLIVTVHLHMTTADPGELGDVMMAVVERLATELQALAMADKLDIEETGTFVSVGKVLGARVPVP